MSHITYHVIPHDGGWAYKAGDAISETFASRDQARAAAELAAREQRVSGEDMEILYEDAAGNWRREFAAARDRPATEVEG